MSRLYVIESADFMLNKHEYEGEPIIRVHEMKGKILLFTANHTYVVEKTPWYRRLAQAVSGWWRR